MGPVIGNLYQMKESYIKKIENKHFKIMPHVRGCGNKFEFLSHIRSLMKCVNCGHTYETSPDMFSNRYELFGSTDPNFLFKRRFSCDVI